MCGFPIDLIIINYIFVRVTNVELNRHNNFECQVSPDNENKHGELRAKAHINVLGKTNLSELVTFARHLV